MRLIDADKLHYDKVWIDQKFDFVVFAKEIDHAPTIDAVHVARCGECKYYKSDTDYCQKNNSGYCVFDDFIKSRTHYCADGERRNDV